MATTEIKDYTGKKWDTIHKNGPFDLKRLYITEHSDDPSLRLFELYNDAAVEIQRLIKEAADRNEGFRAYGSRWSMSSIAHQKDNLHMNAFLNIRLDIRPNECHPDTSYLPENLFFFECGNIIKEISEYIDGFGKSIKASGASNGQTIAGCISTGVHGSGLDAGAVQDFVVGLNIITGPNPEDIVYLERASKPALSDEFGAQLNARVIRDDALFNAALVGLGSFGFIHGVTIEAEDRFLLKRYIRKIPKDQAMQLANTMNFKDGPVVVAEEVDEEGKPLRPYHYKVFINQYSKDSEYVVELMYKKKFFSPYPDPFPVKRESLSQELISIFVKIAEKLPKAIPKLVKALEKTVLPVKDIEKVVTGKLMEIFWDSEYKGPAFAISFGVDHRNASKVMELLGNLTVEKGPVPGIFAMRFVKQTQATLGFTKFPITSMIEINGITWEGNNRIPGLKDVGKMMIDVLQENNIEFTIHWGKNAYWEFPGLLEYMFDADKIESWRAARNALLSDEMKQVFSNKFIQDLGL
jgi:hypothetical protein